VKEGRKIVKEGRSEGRKVVKEGRKEGRKEERKEGSQSVGQYCPMAYSR
jgi:hypothetical protein